MKGKRYRTERLRTLLGFLLILLLLFFLAFMTTGCKRLKEIVEVPVYVHDTTESVRELHDSVYVDRWHTEYQRGDTIFITNIEVKYKERTLTDTLRESVEVPVEVKVTEIREVEKPLTWWQQTKMKLFWLLSLAAVVNVLLFLRRFKSQK